MRSAPAAVRGASTTDDGNGNINTSSTLPTSYSVADGWRYGWTVGYDQSLYNRKHLESSSWLGAINLGSQLSSGFSIEPAGPPKLLGEGGYFYLDAGAGKDDPYHYSTQTVTTSAGEWKETFHQVRSTWYGKKTYISDYERKQGQTVLNNHDINAHRSFGIEFFGGAEATVTVS